MSQRTYRGADNLLSSQFENQQRQIEKIMAETPPSDTEKKVPGSGQVAAEKTLKQMQL